MPPPSQCCYAIVTVLSGSALVFVPHSLPLAFSLLLRVVMRQWPAVRRACHFSQDAHEIPVCTRAAFIFSRHAHGVRLLYSRGDSKCTALAYIAIIILARLAYGPDTMPALSARSIVHIPRTPSSAPPCSPGPLLHFPRSHSSSPSPPSSFQSVKDASNDMRHYYVSMYCVLHSVSPCVL